jgi:hypothetical protein
MSRIVLNMTEHVGGWLSTAGTFVGTPFEIEHFGARRSYLLARALPPAAPVLRKYSITSAAMRSLFTR